MLNPPKLKVREEITEFPSLSAPEPAMKTLLYNPITRNPQTGTKYAKGVVRLST